MATENMPTFKSIDELANYLADYDDNTTDNPVPVKVELDLDIYWKELLIAIESVKRYIALDLSSSTGMKDFDPKDFDTGKKMIVRLVLPENVRRIDGSFEKFINLAEISFSASVKFYKNAFTDCRNLLSFILTKTGFLSVIEGGKALVSNNTELVAYPSASGSIVMNNIKTIWTGAFKGCTGLTSVSFPAAANVGRDAFAGCVNLTKFTLIGTGHLSVIEDGRALVRNDKELVAYPSASGSIVMNNITSIGESAFERCAGLISISFPAVANVGRDAFAGCVNLTNFTLIGTGFLSVIEDGRALVRNDAELVAYPSASGSIVMNNITSIGESAFERCTGLTSVSFPDVTSIGESAFERCTGLISVSFPDVTSISYNAFEGCTGLISANFPAVRNIDRSAFYDCTGLSSISISASTSIDEEVFVGCSNLRNFILIGTGSLSVIEDGKALVRNDTELIAYPSASGSIVMNNITSIAKWAFYGCTGLISVSFSAVTNVGYGAFRGCAGLVRVSCPVVADIGSRAFAYCTSLGSVSCPVVTNIGGDAFWGCTGLISISFPMARNIGYSAFADCTNLTSISFSASANIDFGVFDNCSSLASFILVGTGSLSVIEDGRALVYNDTELVAYPSASGSIVMNNITTIHGWAFSQSANLASISFPAVTSIDAGAFSCCANLISASFPKVTRIDSWAFYGCTGLVSVSISASTNIVGNAFVRCISLINFILIGAGSLSVIEDGRALVRNGTELVAYPSASGSIVMNNITSIGEWTFADCIGLISASFPVATSIGRNAFSYCTSLESVNFPATVSIWEEAFYNCDSLTSVSFPATTSVEREAFYNCNSISSINFPVVTSIDAHCFDGCASLASANFPAATSIGDCAFDDCTSLASVNFPEIASIGCGAFSRCVSLTEVSFPMVASIGRYAFEGCIGLISASFPAAMSIADNVFCGCTSLISFMLTGTGSLSVIEDGRALVRNDTELAAYPSASSSIVMNNIASIGKWAFYGCIGLTSVSFPATTSIGEDVFWACTSLTSVTLGTIAEADFHADAVFGNLRDVYFAPGGGAGTYTTVNFGDDAIWIKQ